MEQERIESERSRKLLESDRNTLAKERRTLSIIIKGIPEPPGENVHAMVDRLLKTMQCSFSYRLTHGAYRLGTTPRAAQVAGNQGQAAKAEPRPIKFRPISKQHKSELYKLLPKLKQDSTYTRVRFENDMDSEEQLRSKEKLLVYHTAKGRPMHEFDVKMKGQSLDVNGTIYAPNRFCELPKGITLEECSTRETPDGVCFQGHCSPLSNFYKCNIEYEGKSSVHQDNCSHTLWHYQMSSHLWQSVFIRNRIHTTLNPWLNK